MGSHCEVSRLVVCIGSPANTMSTPGSIPGALLLSPLSPPFAAAAELLPAAAVTASDAAAAGLLPPEQAEAMSQKVRSVDSK